jgi:hypothetical protein
MQYVYRYTTEFQKQGSEHSDAESFILTCMCTRHIGSGWYTPDFHVVTIDV